MRALSILVSCGLPLLGCAVDDSADLGAVSSDVSGGSQTFPSPAIYSELVPTSSGLAIASGDTSITFEAPNGKTVTALVKAPVGITAATTYFVPAIGSNQTADAYFAGAIAAAVTAKKHRVVFPKGVYQFVGPTLAPLTECNISQAYACAPHWQIGSDARGVTDLEIDGSGSTLDFNAPTRGIEIDAATRLRLANFVIDYPNVPMATLGTIQATSAGNQLVLDASTPAMPVPDTTNGYPGIAAVDLWVGSDDHGTFERSAGNNVVSDEVYFTWQDAAHQPNVVAGPGSGHGLIYMCDHCARVASPYPSACDFTTSAANGGCANFDYFPVGARVVVRFFTMTEYGIYVSASDDVDLENITLNAAPGDGIVVRYGAGHRGFRVAGSHLVRKTDANGNPTRPLSVMDGGIDLDQLAGDVILDGNEIADNGDDAFNMYPDALTGNTVTAVSATQATVQLTGGCGVAPGDVLAMFAASQAFLGTATVAAATCTSNVETVTMRSCSAGCQATFGSGGLDAHSAITDLTEQAGARYVIQHDYHHGNRGHGLFLNTPYGVVQSNTFANNTLGSIALDGDITTGIAPANLTITGNTLMVSSTRPSIAGYAQTRIGNLVTTPVFEKLTIENNTMTVAGDTAITLFATSDAALASNTCNGSPLISGSTLDAEWDAATYVDGSTITPAVQPAGIFHANSSLYYSNGTRYCQYGPGAFATCGYGSADADAAPTLGNVPSGMAYDGYGGFCVCDSKG
nr:hypothetical protein [Kofleriaceae bacterium]